jgi:UDP-N-acetylglucosamine 2-epimerase (non-hydrolysing)
LKKVAVLLGTRPEAIKLVPIIKELQKNDLFEPITISTGQHLQLLQQVIDLFDIKIDYELKSMTPNQSLSFLSSILMERISEVLIKSNPDLVIAQGDTTTTLIGALGSFYQKIPFAHIEAGLRTNNIYSPYPEEANRRLISILTSIHFAPTEGCRQNLLKENISSDQIIVTGNTVIDTLLLELENQKDTDLESDINNNISRVVSKDWRDIPYILVTSHRRENFEKLGRDLCEGISELSKTFPNYRFIFPIHLNPNIRLIVRSCLGGLENVRLISPRNYREFVMLMKHCKFILTDSGGIQEEATVLGKPILVMRQETERPEGVDSGNALLVKTKEEIIFHSSQLLTNPKYYDKMAVKNYVYGDGLASDLIIQSLEKYLQNYD